MDAVAQSIINATGTRRPGAGAARRRGQRGGPSQGSSGTVEFLPASLANCTIHFDAGKQVTLDGSSKVQSWTNQAGVHHSATQPTAGVRPTMTTLNGQPAIAFNGTTQFLGDATATAQMFTTLNGRTTAFIVWEHLTGTGIQVPLHIVQTGAQEGYFYTGITSNQGGYLHRTSNAVGTKLDGKRIVTGRNGASNLISYNKATLHASVAAASGTAALYNYSIGCYGSASSFFGGSIAEIIIYDRELLDAERTQVVDYLSTKYGI